MESARTARTRRSGSTPWKRKRSRAIWMLCGLLLLFLPALVWRVRLASEVQDILDTYRELGRPLSLDDLPGSPIDPADNAATGYREAAAAYRTVSAVEHEALPFLSSQMLPVGQPLPADMRRAMASLVEHNQDALKSLYAAAALPMCQFVVHYEPVAGKIDLSHRAACLTLSNLLCYDALLHADRGDVAAANRSLVAALAVAQSLENDGLFDSLRLQWQLEERILASLQWVAGAVVIEKEVLAKFREQFSPRHRAALWQRCCDVEQCLFLARIGRGSKGGMVRNILISAGLGHLNLRGYLSLMAGTRDGFGMTLAEQRPLMDRRVAVLAGLDRHPMLYMTLSFNLPPADWTYMRAMWDEAKVAEVGLAILAFRNKQGGYPESLGELVPGCLEVVPLELTEGRTLHYEHLDRGFRLWSSWDDGERENRWSVLPLSGSSP